MKLEIETALNELNEVVYMVKRDDRYLTALGNLQEAMDMINELKQKASELKSFKPEIVFSEVVE